MELSEGIMTGRAVRRFTPQEVSPAILDEVFELAKWVPVIGFLHRWSWQLFTGWSLEQFIDLISRNIFHLQDIFLVNMDVAHEARARPHAHRLIPRLA